MKNLKRKSLAALSDGLAQYDNQHNSLKKTNFTDLQSFISGFLNEPDKKRRKKLLSEFQKRHAELYQFLKENPELVAAETEMSRMVSAAVNGETIETDNKQLSNLFEMIEESMQHDRVFLVTSAATIRWICCISNFCTGGNSNACSMPFRMNRTA